jgi:hypothetical protein
MKPLNLASPAAEPVVAPATGPAKSRLWIWFVGVCLLQIAAWTGWFIIASKHPVQSVPLETSLKP